MSCSRLTIALPYHYRIKIAQATQREIRRNTRIDCHQFIYREPSTLFAQTWLHTSQADTIIIILIIAFLVFFYFSI